ncbi:hypothetical protein AYI68_g8193 [Smittium mucronatum]|uniref:Uncharacterized protein n=1 Tax=Smittium mucronatum TaxID=133383 RepID=A0A1R0GLK7_9FUNG|nr:hypothetical protein AYI68_g8193 [Smittium mucronatum]
MAPIECYEEGTFGMSGARVKPIKAEISKPIRIFTNLGNPIAIELVRVELGIKYIFLKIISTIECAYHKWPTLKTWITDPIKLHINPGMSTMVNGNARWIKKLCRKLKFSNKHYNK